MAGFGNFTEGQTIYDKQGNPFVVKGGQPVPAGGASDEEKPSFFQDVKAGAVPWAARGVETTLGTIGDTADLAGRGLSAASGYIPSYLGGNYVQKAGDYLQNSTVAKDLGSETMEKYGDPLVKGMGFDPNYQPQTSGGGFVRTGLQFAPAALASVPFGPEAMATALARGTGATVASEGLGQLSDAMSNDNPTAGAVTRTIGALAGHHFAPRVATMFPAENQARVVAADQLKKDLKDYGGTVDAAQRTGSSTLRGLLGPAPDNNEAVTKMLLDKSGAKFNQGDPLQSIATAATQQAKQDYKLATQRATMIRDQGGPNTFAADKARIKAEADAAYPVGSKQQKQFQDALDKVNKDPLGKTQTTPTQPARPGQLTGANYVKMRDEFLSSKNEHVQQLGQALESAAHRTAGAPWQQLDQRTADAARLQAGATAAAPFGTSLSPEAILNATGKNNAALTASPMTEAAQRTKDVLTPIPGKPSNFSKAVLPAASAMAAALMSPAAHAPTMAILGGMLGSDAHPAITQMRAALLRQKPFQALLGNQRFIPGRDYVPMRRNLLQRGVGLAGPVDQILRQSDSDQ